jgi:alginate O-acetyltransferase complex protein AlgI
VTFSGFPFLLGFLPLVLCGFAVVGRWGEAWAKRWLIAASLLFYFIGAPWFLPLLVLSVGGNFALLHGMYRSNRTECWMVGGVGLNLAVLGWFKYLDALTGLGQALGLSFFTFTQIGCLLHHGDGETPPPKLRDYVLFAAFFPALLAGPILNPRDMLPQFARTEGWSLCADNLSVGSGFFLVGLLKKTLLADPLSTLVGPCFADPAALTLFPAWAASAAYSLQLYFDFSGYTDMAIGLGWMVGLRFPDNFDQPYRSNSVIAYWQRWHISLTRFLMTNVHAPLTMAVLRRRRRHDRKIDAAAQATVGGFFSMIAAPIVATMVLIALWHGATTPFLMFGLLHAAFLVVNHAWRLARAPVLPPFVSVGLTYLCVLVASVLFRATTLEGAGSMLAGMAGLHGLGAIEADIHAAENGIWLLALYAIVWFAPTTRQFVLAEPGVRSGVLAEPGVRSGRLAGPRPWPGMPAEPSVRLGGLAEYRRWPWTLPGPHPRLGWRPSPRWAIAMGCAATLGLLAAGGTGEFLYFRF